MSAAIMVNHNSEENIKMRNEFEQNFLSELKDKCKEKIGEFA